MLVLNNVTKCFPGAFEPTLKEINLSLKDGEFCVVIGSNGSGKSTLMKVSSGEYIPSTGSVTRKGMAAQVVQDINQGTIPAMTLLENIALSQMRYKKPKLGFYTRYTDEIINKIRKLEMGLESYLDQPLSNLSGGQRQIIATLMAINSGAQILLLDEHTSALDPKMQVMLMEYTATSIAQLKLTTMMITHRMDDAIKYGNRLIMLHKGRIVLNLAGSDKAQLKVQELLALFHKYEDESLLAGEVI